MKQQIKNLYELEAFLMQLPHEQKTKMPTFMVAGDPREGITAVEITEEPFYCGEQDSEIGYESELRKMHGPSFDPKNYRVLEPVGTVLFHLG